MKTAIAFLALAAIALADSTEPTRILMPGSPFGIAWGMVYGQPFAKSETFLPQIRKLNAGFTKVILFWSQLEPVKGTYNWAPLDAFLDQLQSPEEAILTLYSSSPWATRNSGWAFPPSPARNPEDYARFVTAVVTRAHGRIRYFQNDSEPNNPMFWAGTNEEFVSQLHVFATAVRKADPTAKIVLGGADGLFDPSGAHPLPNQDKSLAFLEYAIAHAAAEYDIFDLHLYSDPYTIPARVEFVRGRMAAHGYQKPIIATESNGPGFFDIPVNRKHHRLLSEFGAPDSPAVRELYADRAKLAPETQMFLQDAPPELESKLQTLQENDLVIRTVLALSAGVQKIAFWDLWHSAAKRDQVTTLLFGKLLLMDYEGDSLSRILPLGRKYQAMAGQLAGVDSVQRIPAGTETAFAFRITRRNRTPIYVVWTKPLPGNPIESGIRLPGCAEEVKLAQTPVFIECAR